jgi:peptidoglycan hydrolase-like protein with peptidoglycan-binding domain
MHLTIGAEGDEVRAVQEKLREFGHDVGPVDGQFGPRTKAAVADFQEARGLVADGVVEARTGNELEITDEIEFPEIEPERRSFRRLIVSNPNYFGTVPELPFEQVTEKAGDTSYEELTCVGYDPAIERLEAVVSIKRTYGYSGDVCTDGSTEYVRFFVDRDRDGTWEDLGLGSTRVFDVPGAKPLSYAVALDLDEERTLCTAPKLPRIRAILSWNDIPTAGDPTYQPVWGNRYEANVQIDTRGPTIGDLVTAVDLDDVLLAGLDLDEPLPFSKPSLDAGALLEAYKGTSVPAHRAGFTAFSRLLSGTLPRGTGDPSMSATPVGLTPFPEPGPGPGPGPEPWPWGPDDYPWTVPLPEEFELDIGDVLDDLAETSGNTQYEELHCVGLQRSVLTGVFTVKKPAGYSGGLCSEGSPEYVAFWERNAAGGWSHLGTTSVRTHDIPGIPEGGLQYAAHLPVDLSHHRKPCGEGPSVVRIRAVLSWNTEPPATNPNFVPTWGNRVETHVHVPSGPTARSEGRLAIGTVGSVPTPFVEQAPGTAANGRATGPSVSNGFTASDAPFGGLVTITGSPDDGLAPAASGAGALKYRVSVRPYRPGGGPAPWTPLTNEFDVFTYDEPWVPQPMTVDADNYYTYVPGTINDVLALWRTSDDGVYELKVEAKRGDGTAVHTDVVSFDDGSTDSEMYVRLDNTRPESAIDITGYVPAGSTSTEPAGECDFLNVGDTVVGTFTAADENLRSYSLFVRPSGPANGATVDETTTPVVLSTGGGDGTWELETRWSTSDGSTEEMDSCGYTVHVRVVDNTIVNNHYSGHRSGDSVGFCLLEEGQVVTGGGE